MRLLLATFGTGYCAVAVSGTGNSDDVRASLGNRQDPRHNHPCLVRHRTRGTLAAALKSSRLGGARHQVGSSGP
jgi:hypothetical protein